MPNIFKTIKDKLFNVVSSEKMTAVGFVKNDFDNEFSQRQINKPNPKGNDLLVKVNAVSVNPVDTKIRLAYDGNDFKVIGFDAVGIVMGSGSNVTKFKNGDRIYYAGSQIRSGSNSEYQLVDERLAALAPKNLDDAQAAAMPLTAITAYEILVDQLGINFANNAAEGKKILIINGAGGVGSILIQLSKWLGMKVYATASKKESIEMIKKMGVDVVVDRNKNISRQLKTSTADGVDYVAVLHDTNQYWDAITEILNPFGTVVSIVENSQPFDMAPLKNKGQQFKWEFMFAKSKYNHDMSSQGQALAQITKLFEAGILKPTLTKTLENINADNLNEAHRLVESGTTVGKISLTAPFAENKTASQEEAVKDELITYD